MGVWDRELVHRADASSIRGAAVVLLGEDCRVSPRPSVGGTGQREVSWARVSEDW